MDSNSEEISSVTKGIFDAIAAGDFDEFKKLLGQHKGSVDLYDENGMTALQHAAYKGNKDMVQLLLDRGADVNSGRHEYNYTALHFGALSGNSEVCKLLLEAGANASATNSVGRSAAQMAAFVGNHHTVITINNYVPVNELTPFTVPHDQSEPLLPPVLLEPLHKFILSVNIHPVRLALNVKHIPGLLENSKKLSKVLELLCEKEMSKGTVTNEVLAFKFHYLSFILRELHNVRDKQKPSMENEEKKHDAVEVFAKKLLKPGKDGVTLDLMETFLKDCVREFPFRDCTTFHQMVQALTSKDPPSALSVINCTINGQRGFLDVISYCSTCGEEKPAKKCSKCKAVQYCDRECQRIHWFVHKKACNRESSAPTTTTKNIDAQELSSELQKLVAG